MQDSLLFVDEKWIKNSDTIQPLHAVLFIRKTDKQGAVHYQSSK